MIYKGVDLWFGYGCNINAVLTDQEVEWVDTTLNNDGRITAFEEKKEYILNKLSKDRERSVEEVVGSRQVLTTIYMQAKELFPCRKRLSGGCIMICSDITLKR
ncbi:MAG: hypothetical protein ABIF87_11740 [Pseudomonadota bacterium]